MASMKFVKKEEVTVFEITEVSVDVLEQIEAIDKFNNWCIKQHEGDYYLFINNRERFSGGFLVYETCGRYVNWFSTLEELKVYGYEQC